MPRKCRAPEELPPGSTPTWLLRDETHPRVEITDALRFWARRTWDALSYEDRVLVATGLRFFEIADGQ